MHNIAVCVSGGGTNLQAILDASREGLLPNGKVALVVSDRESAGALGRAEAAGVPNMVIPKKRQSEITGAFRDFFIDYVVLSGYLSILPGAVIETYRNRIINIHPALCPAFSGMGFYGLKVHEAVLDSGVKITGATVHFADEGVDTGAILMQRAVPVRRSDTPETLRDRVLQTEHALIVEAVAALTDGRVAFDGGKAWITDKRSSE